MKPGSPTVYLTTLGCAKNQVDSEKVTALVAAAGYGSARSAEEADVVMVNTCAFIEAASSSKSRCRRDRDVRSV